MYSILYSSFKKDLNERKQVEILVKLLWEAEQSWWTWYESHQKDVFAFLIVGILSSDMMFGNPAAGATSVKDILSIILFKLNFNKIDSFDIN